MSRTDRLRFQYVEEQYKVLTVLGGNREGQVFLAQDRRTGKVVVKKNVASGVIQLYSKLREIKTPYLPKIYETVTDGDRGIIIEEYISGVTLGEYLVERGKLMPEEVIQIMAGLCDVLRVVHEQGIVHRDLNPNNIMLSGDGVVKLIDFGIAREIKEAQKQDTTILGTVGYAAPEQFGFMQTDARTDIYALGVLMNVLLTGENPKRRLYQKQPFADVIVKCMEIDPGRRFATVFQMQEALGIADESGRQQQISRWKERGIYRKGYTVRGLPGFRTGILWKNVVASVGYGFMLLSTWIFLQEYAISVKAFVLELLAVFLYIWAAALMAANVGNWDRKVFPIRLLPLPLRITIRVVLWMVLFSWGISIEDHVKYVLLGLPMK